MAALSQLIACPGVLIVLRQQILALRLSELLHEQKALFLEADEIVFHMLAPSIKDGLADSSAHESQSFLDSFKFEV